MAIRLLAGRGCVCFCPGGGQTSLSKDSQCWVMTCLRVLGLLWKACAVGPSIKHSLFYLIQRARPAGDHWDAGSRALSQLGASGKGGMLRGSLCRPESVFGGWTGKRSADRVAQYLGVGFSAECSSDWQRLTPPSRRASGFLLQDSRSRAGVCTCTLSAVCKVRLQDLNVVR